MIRLLLIGPEAPEWSGRIASVAPAVDLEAVRLPAAAVRSFETTPPDAVCYCWAVGDDRLALIAEAIRNRPLGRLVPSILIGEAELDDIELRFEADSDPSEILRAVAELLGVAFDELRGEEEHAETASVQNPARRNREHPGPERPGPEHPGPDLPEPERPEPEQRKEEPPERVSEAVIEQKLREVRHEPYFTILEVSSDSSPQQLRDAYERLSRKFAAARISPELTRRFGAELDEVREGLEDAYAVLSDDRLRETFQR